MSRLLDVKDKKLLYYLSQAGRETDSELAKLLNLSKNSVKYRIQRLKDEKVIKNFSLVVNLGSINVTTATVLFKFNEDIYENERIINFFKNHPLVDWLVTLSGDWDLFVEFTTKDIMHLTEMIKRISIEFSGVLNSYQVFYSNDTLRVEHLVEDFYKDLRLKTLEQKKRTLNKHVLDNTDRLILKALSSDSSDSYITLAQKLNLTNDIIRYRIKNLVNNQIIIKFFPEIDLKKLGYTEHFYRIKLKNMTVEKEESIKCAIRNNPNITYAFMDVVSANIIFICAFKTPDEMDHLARNLRKDYKDIIDKQEYLIIKEQVLFDLFPKGLLEP